MWRKIIILTSTLIFVVACSSSAPDLPEGIPAQLNQDVFFDKDIKINIQNVKLLDRIVVIDLVVANMTNKEIWFSNDFGIQIFGLKGNWVQLDNQTNYFNSLTSEGFTLRPYKDIFDAGILQFSLSEEDYFNSERLLVVIIGNSVNNGNVSKRKIGSYLDESVK
jgi:hypothetical protein